jgi:hypothetical protein
MDEEYFHRFNDATNAAIIRLIYTALLCIIVALKTVYRTGVAAVWVVLWMMSIKTIFIINDTTRGGGYFLKVKLITRPFLLFLIEIWKG